jgi:hypothetical protein
MSFQHNQSSKHILKINHEEFMELRISMEEEGLWDQGGDAGTYPPKGGATVGGKTEMMMVL